MSFYIAFAVGLLFLFINKLSLRKPVETEGRFILEFHPVFKWIGVVSMVFSFVFPVFFLVSEKGNMAAYIVSGCMFTFLFATGAFLFLLQRNHRVAYDDKDITANNFRNIRTQFAWHDIESFRLNNLSGNYIVKLVSGKKISINQNLMGVRHFINQLSQKT